MPLSEKYWYRMPFDRLEFDAQEMKVITDEMILDGSGDLQTRIRQLPIDDLRRQDVVHYGELATGSRLNDLGEFEFLTAAEWQELKRRSPDFLAPNRPGPE